jgi:putative phosphoesterase
VGHGVSRVGIISDTHGYFSPQLLAIFKGVSLILHAGDIGRLTVIRQLEAIAPVQAVRGNVDGALRSSRFPHRRLVRVEQVTILVTHFGLWSQELAAWLWQEHGLDRPDVFVYGHSHLALQHWEGGTLFFNPGAAGRSRLGVVPSVGILSVVGGEVAGQIVSLHRP